MTIDAQVAKIKTTAADPQDPKAIAERDAIIVDRLKLELECLQYELEARKTYGKSVFRLVCGWIISVLMLVFISGYPTGPKISDGVLIALITGMSVNVIALLAIVINYLFPKRGKD